MMIKRLLAIIVLSILVASCGENQKPEIKPLVCTGNDCGSYELPQE